jgi:hypothetical protein
MNTLALVREAKLHKLLPDRDADCRLEASGVLALGDQFLVIFDNLSELARISASLSPGDQNEWLVKDDDTTGVEDITYNPRQQRFYLLIEASPVVDATAANGRCHRAEIVEYDHLMVRRDRHPLPFDFASDNKGFEGLTWIEREGDDYVLALCEGNGCLSGSEGRERGNGTIQVFRRVADGWKHAATLAIPATAQFVDYSSIDVRDGRVVVLSQENGQLWVGALRQTGWGFVDDGAVHALPRNEDGRPSYCNAEGVAWLAGDRVAIVSDRKKKDAPKRCGRTDQAIHLFDLAPAPGTARTK